MLITPVAWFHSYDNNWRKIFSAKFMVSWKHVFISVWPFIIHMELKHGKTFSISSHMKNFLTLSGLAFSVVRHARGCVCVCWGGGGGGWEAQMPKIKIFVNRLKSNLARVIVTIKALLMQNLSMVALLVLEIWRHKISLGRKEQVMKFNYLPKETGLTIKKMVLCPESFFSTQNSPFPCQFQQFSSRRIFFFIFSLDEKRAASTPWLINFAKCWSDSVF